MTIITPEAIHTVAEAIKAEMRTLRVEWFVEDSKDDSDCNIMTPYTLLAMAALRAVGFILPDGF